MEYRAKLNNAYGACATCDKFDKCNLYTKNTSDSVYCTEFELKYGCSWVYEKSRVNKNKSILNNIEDSLKQIKEVENGKRQFKTLKESKSLWKRWMEEVE